ncbi:hypothetical protein GGX14DRAFT_645999 [Mycena pura]|uniref:Uncharacterized protein n=1 Tax=Mycena pura TaxID=153505 RepID=A0AAD6V9J0_9AGAR|nr:hypothetical protein GGX14DRAFT_645999 [Mycena pura]
MSRQIAEFRRRGLIREHLKRWTFRRIDSLRLWAGALKIRYLLPIVVPPQPATATASSSSLPSSPASPQRFYAQQPLVMFDAKAIARKDPGWDDLLETTVHRWGRVVAEKGET